MKKGGEQVDFKLWLSDEVPGDPAAHGTFWKVPGDEQGRSGRFVAHLTVDLGGAETLHDASRDLVGQPEFEVDLFVPFFHAPGEGHHLHLLVAHEACQVAVSYGIVTAA
jgi:hypothetical protein